MYTLHQEGLTPMLNLLTLELVRTLVIALRSVQIESGWDNFFRSFRLGRGGGGTGCKGLPYRVHSHSAKRQHCSP